MEKCKKCNEVGTMIAKSLLIYLSITCASTLKLPDQLPKCKRNDPKLNECIKSSYGPWLAALSKGLPQFKAAPIEPMRIKSMSIGEGSGPVRLVQNYKDVSYHHLDLTTVTSVEATITDTELKVLLEIFSKNFTFLANYSFEGNLMGVPISSNGKSKIVIGDVKLPLDLIGNINETDGEKYVQIQTVKVALNPATVKLGFENFVDGDEERGAIMNKLLDDNAMEIFNDVKRGYEESVEVVLKQTLNNVLSKVPVKDLFLE